MNEDDQLFARCLIVAATLTGCAVAALALVGPTLDMQGELDGVEETGPRAREHRSSVTFLLPGSSYRARLATSLGESAAPASSASPAMPSNVETPRAARYRRGNAGAASMVPSPGTGTTSAAPVESASPLLGMEPTLPVRGAVHLQRPAVTWPEEPRATMPPLAEMHDMEAVNIVVDGPGNDADDGSLASQGTARDPLPEFRRYLPRAQACATREGRRNGEPLSGKIVLAFTVAESGWVTRSDVVGGSIRDPDARECLSGALQSERFFAPRHAPLDAERVVLFTR